MNKKIAGFAGAALCGRNPHEAGLELLSGLYKDATGRALPVIARTPAGKPYFPTDPLYFSITHSKNHVFCILSEVPVGIDAEEADRDINLGLADKILSAGERVRWEAASDKRMALLRLWVLKEASVKLSGEGLRGYPVHTDFHPDDPRIMLKDGCILAIVTDDMNGQ